MMQALNPYTSTAKTAEIMARYRPIAPRPQTPATAPSNAGDGDANSTSPSSMSPTIRQSPYLRNVWPHLQSRPTRTRKRGRTSVGPPPPFKRPRTLLQGLSPAPFHIQGFAPPPMTTFAPVAVHLQSPPTAAAFVTLPLLPCSASVNMQPTGEIIDLNKAAEIPEEKDLLAQLQKPTGEVISPRPVRLIPSSIAVRAIKDDAGTLQISPAVKKPDEVEKELESEVLPAFVSDSNNKVRLVNSAYKHLVGQPECPWLDTMVAGDGGGVACKSICGQVVLHFSDLDPGPTRLSDGFSCWARIEWGMNGKKKNLVNAFGEAMKLACESKDYKFAWRFHTREASEAASNV